MKQANILLWVAITTITITDITQNDWADMTHKILLFLLIKQIQKMIPQQT